MFKSTSTAGCASRKFIIGIKPHSGAASGTYIFSIDVDYYDNAVLPPDWVDYGSRTKKITLKI